MASCKTMFGFVQNIFAPPAHPIGVDFGADSLRLAQVQSEGDDFKLLAAASADVPPNVRDDPAARSPLLRRNRPASSHPRQIPRPPRGPWPALFRRSHPAPDRSSTTNEKHLKDAILRAGQTEASLRSSPGADSPCRRWPSTSTTMHPRLHVVVMAADTRWVNQYIAAARKAALDVSE